MSYQDLAAKYADHLSESRQQVLKLEQELASRDSHPICGTQTSEVSALRCDLDTKKTEVQELKAALCNQQNEVDDKNASITSLKGEVEKLQADVQCQNQLNLQLRATLNTERNETECKKEHIIALEASISGLETELETAKAGWNSACRQAQERKDALKVQQEENESKHGQLVILEGSVAKLKADLETKSAQLSSLNTLLAAQKALVDERDARITDLMNLPGDEEEEVDGRSGQTTELCDAFRDRRTELQAFRAQTEVLESHVTSLQAQVEVKEQRVRELEEALQGAHALRTPTGEDDTDSLASQLAEARDRATDLGRTVDQAQSDLVATRKDLEHSWELVRLWEERHNETSNHLGARIRDMCTHKLVQDKKMEELREQLGQEVTEADLKKTVEEVGAKMIEFDQKYGPTFQGCRMCLAKRVRGQEECEADPAKMKTKKQRQSKMTAEDRILELFEVMSGRLEDAESTPS